MKFILYATSVLVAILTACIGWQFYRTDHRLSVPAVIRSIPLQTGKSKECGPISLYIAAKLLGKETNYTEVTALLPLTNEGCSILQVHEAAQKLALRSEPVQVTFSEMRQQLSAGKAAIVYFLRKRHFMTAIHSQTPGSLLLLDENEPSQVMEEFLVKSGWEGHVLLLER